MNKKSKLLWLLVAIALTGWFGVMNALAWPVPDTGQTKCYDTYGNVFDPCPSPGQAFYGQDASYTINPMSYNKLDADGTELPDDAGTWVMVRDNVTGLIWENKTNDGTIHDKDNTYTWYDSNPESNGSDPGTPGDGATTFDTEQFINALNAANYGGQHDWRMPSFKELASIINYSIPDPGPIIDVDYFSNTAASGYWSSTTQAGNIYSAWNLDFGTSRSNSPGKHDSYYVRAVRGGQPELLDYLVSNGDGTVTDTDTGLMWQQDPSNNSKQWNIALSSSEYSNLADYTDWRLPTIKELHSLVDYRRFNPAINLTYFPDTQQKFTVTNSFWTGSRFSLLKLWTG